MSSDQALKTNTLGDTSVPSNAIKRVSHQTVIEEGLAEDDVTKIAMGLVLAESRQRKDSKLLAATLAKCIPYGSLNALRYLIKEEKTSLTRVFPGLVSQCPAAKVVDVLQILVDNGWDINQHDEVPGGGIGKDISHHICNNEDVIRWCLNHGAIVEDTSIDPYYNPPLLECVARHGTVSIFKLLQSQGAEISMRTLHQAVDTAGVSGGHRFEMVKYLVEELGLDVNALDGGEGRPNFWGTPLCYAAHWQSGGKDVVQYLLDHGADPLIKNTRGDGDSFSIARSSKNKEVMDVLEAWTKIHMTS